MRPGQSYNQGQTKIFEKEKVAQSTDSFEMLKRNDYCLIYLSTKRFLRVHEENDCYVTEGKVIDSTFSQNFIEKIKNLESSDICRLIT